jgi:arabinose-5-phosphate isomerase
MERQAQQRAEFTFRQEKAAVDALAGVLREKSFGKAADILASRNGKIITTGVGKSGFVAMKVAATLTSLGHGAFFLDPMAAMHGDAGMVCDGDVIIAFSFSGESPELAKLLKYLQKNFSIGIVGITGNKNSTLAKISNTALILQVKEEGCPLGLAPMASTTASLVVGDLLASALTAPETFKKEHFAKFHPGGSLGLSLKKVKDILSKDKKLPVISEDMLLGDALGFIAKHYVGFVGVTNAKGVLSGIITDGDVRRILMKHENPKIFAVKKLMTKNPKKISEGKSLKDALAVMEKHKITNLFVVDEKGILSGVLHIHDIIGESLK